ncbi:hypothetical protein, partial [Bilophila wadsworthia]|uniref:hypothetical protein n=1 Tax=Bilophila wadsworthia TaxID=35833 RepID=UPI00307BE9A4
RLKLSAKRAGRGEEDWAGRRNLSAEWFRLPSQTHPSFDLIESLISSGGMAAFWGEKLLIRRGLLGTIVMFFVFHCIYIK